MLHGHAMFIFFISRMFYYIRIFLSFFFVNFLFLCKIFFYFTFFFGYMLLTFYVQNKVFYAFPFKFNHYVITCVYKGTEVIEQIEQTRVCHMLSIISWQFGHVG